MKCKQCNGRGKIQLFTSEVNCEVCGGSGVTRTGAAMVPADADRVGYCCGPGHLEPPDASDSQRNVPTKAFDDCEVWPRGMTELRADVPLYCDLMDALNDVPIGSSWLAYALVMRSMHAMPSQLMRLRDTEGGIRAFAAREVLRADCDLEVRKEIQAEEMRQANSVADPASLL